MGHRRSTRTLIMRALAPVARAAGMVPLPALDLRSLGATWNLAPETISYQHAYSLIPTLALCVDLYQSTISSTPLRFYVGEGDSRTELERAPGNIAELIAKANTEQSGGELIEDIVGSMLLAGNAYLFKDYVGTRKVQQFWVLDPSTVTPKRGPNGRSIVAYEVRLGGAPAVMVPRQQMVHFKRYDPFMRATGLSVMSSLQVAYETQRDSSRFMREFYRRGGTVAGHYSTEVALDEDDVEVLRKQLKKAHEGPENAWSPVILPKKLQFVRAGLTMQEMQFAEAHRLTKEEMLTAFKVPKMFANITEGSGLNSDVASVSMMMLVRFALMPLCTRIAATLNERLLGTGEFGASLSCEFDFSNDPVMVESWLKRAEMWAKATGAPVAQRAEARDHLALPPMKGTDNLLVPMTLDIETGTRDNSGDASASDKPKVNASEPDDDEEKASKRRVVVQDARMSVDHRRAAADVRLRRHERVVERFARRVFAKQEAAVVDNLRAQQRGATVDLDFLARQLDDPEYRRMARAIIKAILQDAGEEAIAQLGLDLAFNLFSAAITEFVASKSASLVTNINATTEKRLRASLAEGTAANEGLAELTARVHDVFKGRRGNANTIARTETTTAYNRGQLEGWKQTGVRLKKRWLAAKDELVRPAHAEVDGTAIPLGTSFTVAGVAMEYPGDPSAPVELNANCRCVLEPVVDNVQTEGRDTQTLEEFLA